LAAYNPFRWNSWSRQIDGARGIRMIRSIVLPLIPSRSLLLRSLPLFTLLKPSNWCMRCKVPKRAFPLDRYAGCIFLPHGFRRFGDTVEIGLGSACRDFVFSYCLCVRALFVCGAQK
jgi:hypothetical protein